MTTKETKTMPEDRKATAEEEARDQLLAIIQQIEDPDQDGGFVTAAELASKLAKRGVRPPDRWKIDDDNQHYVIAGNWIFEVAGNDTGRDEDYEEAKRLRDFLNEHGYVPARVES